MASGGYNSDRVYDGPEKFVVAMDIGTTQTAVSYAHFSPGSRPEVKLVQRWPGHAVASGCAKIPTLVYYRYGRMVACGEEAVEPLEEDQRNVARQFKLHIHPPAMAKPADFEIPELPSEVSVERAYTDMMAYLMRYTQDFVENASGDGSRIWSRLRSKMTIVLATPNGWYTLQQAKLRRAAVMAGLVTEQNASELLDFITEAEASVHYALYYRPTGWLQCGTTFGVIDAGGSTVDTTIYKCTSASPLKLEAVADDCVQAGGIFVNHELKKILEKKLKGSQWGDEDIIKGMVDHFEKEKKGKFNGSTPTNSTPLKFCGPRGINRALGIINNQISLSDEELAGAFREVEGKIIKSISSLLRNQAVDYLLMVGGFGESPYLQKVLQSRFGTPSTKFVLVGDYPKKAAAEGATIWYIKNLVKSRPAKATFGACVRMPYQIGKHYERRGKAYIDVDGELKIDNEFQLWATKGDVIEESFAYKSPYYQNYPSLSQFALAAQLGTVTLEIYSTDDKNAPVWCKSEDGELMPGMSLACTLKADLSALAPSLQLKRGPEGKQYYRVDFSVCVYFAATQLRARLQWYEKGLLRDGLVEVIPGVIET